MMNEAVFGDDDDTASTTRQLLGDEIDQLPPGEKARLAILGFNPKSKPEVGEELPLGNTVYEEALTRGFYEHATKKPTASDAGEVLRILGDDFKFCVRLGGGAGKMKYCKWKKLKFEVWTSRTHQPELRDKLSKFMKNRWDALALRTSSTQKTTLEDSKPGQTPQSECHFGSQASLDIPVSPVESPNDFIKSKLLTCQVRGDFETVYADHNFQQCLSRLSGWDCRAKEWAVAMAEPKAWASKINDDRWTALRWVKLLCRSWRKGSITNDDINGLRFHVCRVLKLCLELDRANALYNMSVGTLRGLSWYANEHVNTFSMKGVPLNPEGDSGPTIYKGYLRLVRHLQLDQDKFFQEILQPMASPLWQTDSESDPGMEAKPPFGLFNDGTDVFTSLQQQAGPVTECLGSNKRPRAPSFEPGYVSADWTEATDDELLIEAHLSETDNGQISGVAVSANEECGDCLLGQLSKRLKSANP